MHGDVLHAQCARSDLRSRDRPPTRRRRLLPVIPCLCLAALSGHACFALECVNGTWIKQAPGGLPDYQCDRDPVAIRWSALTQERCTAYKDDADWDVQDPYILRKPYWQSAASLLRHFLHGKTLWLVGDSMTGLFYHGLTCELWRHGQVLAPAPELERAIEALGTNKSDWPGPQSSLHVYYWTKTNTTVIVLGCNKVHPPAWELLLEYGPHVVMFNYGLHYDGHETHEFKRDIDWLVRRLAAWPGLAVWREAGAQHFPGSAYDRATQARDDGTWTCGTTDPAFLYNNSVWERNQYVHAAIAAHAPGVMVLDFYNLTTPRANMLEGRYCDAKQRRFCLDCTHYTWTPQLYASLYHALYMLLAQHAKQARTETRHVTGK